MTDRTDYVILGRKVGMGRDSAGDSDKFCIYDLKPAIGVACPAGDVWFNLVKGQVEIFDHGNVTWSDDIFVVLQNAERAEP